MPAACGEDTGGSRVGCLGRGPEKMCRGAGTPQFSSSCGREVPEKGDEVWVREPAGHTGQHSEKGGAIEPPLHSQGYAGLCSDRQRAPLSPSLGSQHLARAGQRTVQTTHGTDSVPTQHTGEPIPRARPARCRGWRKGCLEVMLSPGEGQGPAEEQLGDPDHLRHLT